MRNPQKRAAVNDTIVPMLTRDSIYAHVGRELDHAYAKHGREQWGRHEFYAILKEEVDELWDAIKADEPLSFVQSEALQVLAMCVRYLETGDRYQQLRSDHKAGKE